MEKKKEWRGALNKQCMSHVHAVCSDHIIYIFPAPPSAPVSLSWEYESSEGGVSLRWKPPLDLGGRSEVTYGVVCRICPSATQTHPGACSWCGDSVTYTPYKSGLRQTKITLSNLLPRVTYLIQVCKLHYPWELSWHWNRSASRM